MKTVKVWHNARIRTIMNDEAIGDVLRRLYHQDGVYMNPSQDEWNALAAYEVIGVPLPGGEYKRGQMIDIPKRNKK